MGKKGSSFTWPWSRKKARAAEEEAQARKARAAAEHHEEELHELRRSHQEYHTELAVERERREALAREHTSTEEAIQASRAAEAVAEEHLQALRQEQERQQRQERQAEAEAAETRRLESELALLGEEAQRLHLHDESTADASEAQTHARGRGPSVILGHDEQNLQQECEPLVAERLRLEAEIQELQAQAVAFEAELPQLRKIAADFRRRSDSSQAEARSLHRDLRRLEVDMFAEVQPSPMAGCAPEHSPSHVRATANIQDVWKLESEADAALRHVSELEQELAEACVRRQQAAQAEVALADGYQQEVVARSPRPLAEQLTSALWSSPVSHGFSNSPEGVRKSPLLGSLLPSDAALEDATAKFVAENGRLRVEAEALHAAILQNEEALSVVEPRCASGFWTASVCSAEPQLEPGLSFSRNRLRAMLQDQLEDSRKLLAGLRRDVAEAERSLWQERCGREECEARLRAAEGVAADGERSSVCREAATSSPPPRPPFATSPVPPLTFHSRFLAEPGSGAADGEALLSDWGDSRSADSSASTSPLGFAVGTSWLM